MARVFAASILLASGQDVFLAKKMDAPAGELKLIDNTLENESPAIPAEEGEELGNTQASGIAVSSESSVSSIQGEGGTCHPWEGWTFTLYVHGWNRGSLKKWLSFANDGTWLYASYDRKAEAMPLFFEGQPGKCHTYFLRNDWPGHGNWVSFTDDGKWLRANYDSKADAMPVKFTSVGNKQYKMQNMWQGEEWWLSYTESQSQIKANYPNSEAMKVELFEKEKPKKQVAVKSVKMCLVSLGSYAGGSKGFHEVWAWKGSSWSSKRSEQTSVSVNAQVSAKLGPAKASLSSTFKNAVQSVESNSGFERMKTHFKVDLAEPCYLYQGVVTVTLTDGSILKQEGEFIAESTQKDAACKNI